MPYTIDFLEDEGIVIIENIGELTYADWVKQSQEVLELGRKKNVGLFLVHFTHLTVQATTFELFDFPALYERIGAPKTNRVAVLLTEDAAINEDIRFYETVCRNRGWSIRVFSHKDEAVEWLLG